jgi:hypothetical protein
VHVVDDARVLQRVLEDDNRWKRMSARLLPGRGHAMASRGTGMTCGRRTTTTTPMMHRTCTTSRAAIPCRR